MVLTPGVCASSLAVMLRSDRTRASAIREATGAIVHRSPGRARRTPLKPFAQGRPGDPAKPVVHPVCIFCSARTCGCQPAPGLPCALVSTRATRTKQSSGGRCREKAKVCLAMEMRVQGMTPALHSPSLRAQRSNPESFRGGTLDCFAALAMTSSLKQRSSKSPRRRPEGHPIIRPTESPRLPHDRPALTARRRNRLLPTRAASCRHQ